MKLEVISRVKISQIKKECKLCGPIYIKHKVITSDRETINGYLRTGMKGRERERMGRKDSKGGRRLWGDG